MSNFYETHVVGSMDSPKLCGLVPIKPLVLLMQMVFAFFFIHWLVFDAPHPSRVTLIFQIFVIIFLVTSFVAFLAEYEVLMRVHHLIAYILTFFPLVLFFRELFYFIKHIASEAATPSSLMEYAGISLLCLFYIWMCKQLILALGRTYILPMFKI